MKLDSSISAIVTGGASGLGLASAKMLAGLGVRVTIFDMDEKRAKEVAPSEGFGFQAVDVSDAENVQKAFERARSDQGIERVLVNCAGIAPAIKTVSRDRESGEGRLHDPAIFAKTIAVNLTGSFNCLVHAARAMMDLEPLNEDGERGIIVNTGSVAAEDGQIGQIAYAASKGGIKSLTLPAARDLAREGIRVCSILPGLFKTPLFDGLPEQAVQNLSKSVPFPARLGSADEYAALVRHICENPMLNGESIRLDGAIRLPPK